MPGRGKDRVKVVRLSPPPHRLGVVCGVGLLWGAGIVSSALKNKIYFLKIDLLLCYVYMHASKCVYTHHIHTGVYGDQKRALELQSGVSSLTWMLGAEAKSSAEAAIAHNCRAISPVPNLLS